MPDTAIFSGFMKRGGFQVQELGAARASKLHWSVVSLVQRGPLRQFGRSYLDNVRWELVPQLQTHAQRFDEALVLRFRSPVDLHEKIFMLLQTARTVCHGTLQWACSKGVSQLRGKRFKWR
jgi:hypothetical protein